MTWRYGSWSFFAAGCCSVRQEVHLFSGCRTFVTVMTDVPPPLPCHNAILTTWRSWFRASLYNSQKWPTRCKCVGQFTVPWLLYMFRVIFSLIMRRISTVFTASGIIHVCCGRLVSWMSGKSVPTHPWHQPVTTYVNYTRSCKYSWDSPHDERKYRSKHVE